MKRVDVGIKKVDANLKDQLILVEGTAAPSAIVSAIQRTGRDAILRGSGKSNSIYDLSLRPVALLASSADVRFNNLDASVCIMETHANGVSNPIRGLARIVQVSSNLSLLDITINGLPPGQYWATIRQTGDISKGPASTGGVWEALKEKIAGSPEADGRGVLGSIDVDESGKGSVFLDRPIAVWEMIGRSMLVSKSKEGPFREDDPNTIVGVIARSAGVWDNDKMVCSCSGQNVWEERKEQASKGIV